MTLNKYGFWTIYAIHDSINDSRLSVEVISPPNSTPPPFRFGSAPYPKPQFSSNGVALVIIIGGALAIGKIVRDKKRKVTSARVYVQIALVFFLFLGVFIRDKDYLGSHSHSFRTRLNWNNILVGVSTPNGLSVPIRLLLRAEEPSPVLCGKFKLTFSHYRYLDTDGV